MNDLTIRLTIPIPLDSSVSAPGLTFSRWLPVGADHDIRVHEGDLLLILSFDVESTWRARQPTADEIGQTVNVLAHRLYADITVAAVPYELLTYLERRDFTHHATASEAELQRQCDDLAERCLLLVLRTVNRLISFVRSRKGQYWLLEYAIDLGRCSSFFIQFDAKARYGESDWFRFGPSNVTRISVVMGDERRYIRAEEWSEIRDFVASSRRTPLAGTLLAAAESLAANGHSRSALTEAITALEVTLFACVRSESCD